MCKVSVIVIAYNIENYIGRCLTSIMNQTFKDIEIIVVNDGSTDETFNVIKKKETLDTRIQSIYKCNSGPMDARKVGLEAAKGEYVLFVDGDDWIHHETINRLYGKAVIDNADIVLFNFFIANGEKFTPSKSYKENILDISDNLKSAILCNILPSMCTKFIRREFIINNKIKMPTNLSYAEDLATTINLFMYHPKLSFLTDNLYYYFQRSGSITKSIDSKLLDIPQAVTYIKNSLIENDLMQKYTNEFNYLAFTHIFYNKIIGTNTYGPIHKKIYASWKKQKIPLKNNHYYHQLIKKSSIGWKIKILAFNFNYYIGIFYINLRRAIGLKN